MDETFIPHSQKPYYADDNDKGYSDFMETPSVILVKAKPIVLKALGDTHFDTSQKRAFTMADYGTAEGGVSMQLFETLIKAVKEKFGDNQEIQILYEDQAIADFNSLFLKIHGLKTNLAESYFKRVKNIFVNTCATNFYAQCFPTASVDFGLSSTAMCWMYERPCALTTSLFHHFSTNETESKMFTEFAKRDYETFLVQRSKELVPGGVLVVCNLTFDKSGKFKAGKMNRKQPYDMLEKYLKDFLNEGVITKEEYEQTTFNLYLMTKEEFVAPFHDQTSAPYKAGLRLELANTVLITCVLNEAWSKNQNKETATKFAKGLSMQTRQWTNWTFMSGLSDRRSGEEKRAIVDILFERYEDDIARAPVEFGEDTVETYLVIRKCC